MRTLGFRCAFALAVIVITVGYHASSIAAVDDGPPRYRFMALRSLDVTNTRGNSINNAGWVAGYSSLANNVARRAIAWFYGQLPTLGGLNGYAAGPNNRRKIVGWAENGVEDTDTCAAPRTEQFRPVVWGPGNQDIHELPQPAP